ncbi:hypothetical protein LguiB_013617 [Lonicera macranthoides]
MYWPPSSIVARAPADYWRSAGSILPELGNLKSIENLAFNTNNLLEGESMHGARFPKCPFQRTPVVNDFLKD